MGCISSMIRPGDGRIVNEKMMVMICYTRKEHERIDLHIFTRAIEAHRIC
jgi:hypothetical protein